MAWYEHAFFYHIYPIGFCGAPAQNDLRSAPVERLTKIVDWIPHLADMGVTAVYLGPVFESMTHGYDTVDFHRVDRRLGTMDTLRRVVEHLHHAGIRVVLDTVFHHVGRAHFAFADLLQRGPNSPYLDWIAGVDFSRRSPLGDPFAYDCWEGHDSLPKLNLHSIAVIGYLLTVLRNWVSTLDVDGLRLDVAYALDPGFLRRFAGIARSLKPDFWLLGEVVHGDYRPFLGTGLLHSVTNYEAFKGLYSSHNDRNYFEIAHALDRQFGRAGLYREASLYNFADNHDVHRVASQLQDPRHLVPLYLLLFTMPGIPSLYYGSEWGVEGRKIDGDDGPLRPNLLLSRMGELPHADLVHTLRAYAAVRRASPALQAGRYETLHVASEQFVFLRENHDERVVAAVNAAPHPVPVVVRMHGRGTRLIDLLDPHAEIAVHGSSARIDLPPTGGRVLRVR